MSPTKSLAVLSLAMLIAACSGVEVKTWEPTQFAAGNFKTYSWRSEPFDNAFYSRDPIYVIDPILREIVDAQLQDMGFRQVPRNGDFTIDYTYARGWRQGAASELTSSNTPRAGVRPNTNVSQAERDNAIALSGVKETHNISLQINSGETGTQIWGADITKIVADINEPDRQRARDSLRRGVNRAFRDLPRVGP